MLWEFASLHRIAITKRFSRAYISGHTVSEGGFGVVCSRRRTLFGSVGAHLSRSLCGEVVGDYVLAPLSSSNQLLALVREGFGVGRKPTQLTMTPSLPPLKVNHPLRLARRSIPSFTTAFLWNIT